jgi:hypothetical protein
LVKVTTSDLIGARYQAQGYNRWLSPDYRRLLTTEQALAELAASAADETPFELEPAAREEAETSG